MVALAMIAVIVLAVYVVRLREDRGDNDKKGYPEIFHNRLNFSQLAIAIEADMDPSVDPCDDFYQFACGGWLKRTTMPDDEASWARTFSVIAHRNQESLRRILEANWPVIGSFYSACMNLDAIEARGSKPIEKTVAEITNEKLDKKGIMKALGVLRHYGVGGLFSFGVEVDSKNSTVYLLDFGQGGLSLPNREYYLSSKEEKKKLRDDFTAHVEKMFDLANIKESKDQAKAVLELETELAKAHLPNAELRDPIKTYNKFSYANFTALAPSIPWDEFFKAAGVNTTEAMWKSNVDVPTYFKALDGIYKKLSTANLRSYATWHTVHALSGQLSSAFRNATFDFYGKRLSGLKVESPRWKVCTREADNYLGEILGRFFVDKYFPKSSRERASELVTEIEDALGTALPSIDWMDKVTEKKATAKLAMIGNHIGFPDKWKDYDSLRITEHDHYNNVLNARSFGYHEELNRMGTAVDRDLWDMTPPTVNAYYDPSANQMVFPAGIIQPTFFNASYPSVLNYGGIGSVMGHELTHSLDDQGAKYDGYGNLKNWWTEETLTKFHNRTKCVSDFYSKLTVNNGTGVVNGTLTMGENVADMGGVKRAFDAFIARTESFGDEERLLSAYSSRQMFFIAYAQNWCSLRRPELSERLLLTDPHSPPEFRVLGPLSNFDKFAEVWQCPAGSKYNPPQKCSVW